MSEASGGNGDLSTEAPPIDTTQWANESLTESRQRLLQKQANESEARERRVTLQNEETEARLVDRAYVVKVVRAATVRLRQAAKSFGSDMAAEVPGKHKATVKKKGELAAERFLSEWCDSLREFAEEMDDE